MLNPNIDPDNSLYDRASDENFEDQQLSESNSEESEVSIEESSEDLRPNQKRRAVNIIEDNGGASSNSRPIRQTRRMQEEFKGSYARRR